MPNKENLQVDMYRVCKLLLGPNFGVWPATNKIFYLRSTVENVYAFTCF